MSPTTYIVEQCKIKTISEEVTLKKGETYYLKAEDLFDYIKKNSYNQVGLIIN